MAIVQAFIELFKIALLIMQKYSAWSLEEQERFNGRVKLWAAEAHLILQNQEDTFNSDAYLKVLSEAKALQYKGYYIEILNKLRTGQGLTSLQTITKGGFHLRYPFIEKDLLFIWNKTTSIDNKAREMAKVACDYVAL